MGIYLNPGNQAFAEALNSEIYVDKSGLIEYTNKVLGTKQKYVCVSRPRRFGKSMAADMLNAYYDRSCDSSEMFEKLEISEKSSYAAHLNQYPVIFMNMQKFLSRSESVDHMVRYLQKKVLAEVREMYGESVKETELLAEALEEVYAQKQESFVFIIDEWDCIFREYPQDIEAQTKYLDFLRDLLKDARYVKLAYMTGILPIKKYGTHSALNMFDEYSMTNPGVLASYVGFTEKEVQELCRKYHVDFQETKRWYDGYQFRRENHIYSPKSVVGAMLHGEFDSYWTQTETYEALKVYIEMNYDGLKDAIILMLGSGKCKINPRNFQNDMTTFKSKDDVLTLLVHLGYLAFDVDTKQVFIPNLEVETEFANAVEDAGWKEVIDAISSSERLLEFTLARDMQAVAKKIEEIHMENTSILNYNDENALSCVISLAYYSARNYYTMIRELPSGKGYADMVFLPRKNHQDKPAMVVELKWDKSSQGAIQQIKDKEYVKALQDYSGKILLVGINYNAKTKKHECMIEEY